MSDLYDDTYDRIREIRGRGVEPDRVVFPSGVWDEVKEKGEVIEDEDVFGGEKTLVNGVRALHNSPPQSKARIIVEVEADE